MRNELDAESAKMLSEVAKQKGISLCGIQRDQTTADFSRQGLKPPDAILLASDLSQAVVTGSLTSLDVRSNDIVGDGAAKLSAAVFGNLKIQMFNKIPIKEMRANSITELDLKGKGIGVEGGLVVAGLLPVMGSLTSLNLSSNHFGAEGAAALAPALAANGSLTVTNLLRNQLDARSAKMLSEVAKQKGISLCGIHRDQTTADFSRQNLKPPDAILLASDLSQAGVTGSLTALNLSSNHIGGHYRNGKMVHTPEGPKAVADALLVNGSLTKMWYVSPRTSKNWAHPLDPRS